MDKVAQPSECFVLTDRVKSLREVISTDHPLSLGHRVVLVTNSIYVDDDLRLTDEELKLYMGCSKSQGAANVYNRPAIITITLNGANLPIHRIIELVVHEMSHYVDGLFERSALKLIDTELRAYYLDWSVGKVLFNFPILVDIDFKHPVGESAPQ